MLALENVLRRGQEEAEKFFPKGSNILLPDDVDSGPISFEPREQEPKKQIFEPADALGKYPRVEPGSIDFESTGPIDIGREPGIYAEPELEDESWIGKTWKNMLKSVRDEKAESVKSANAVAMAESLGISPSQAYDNLNALSKEVGLRGQPTFQELIEGMAIGGVTAGLLANPIATVIGVGTFMSLAELENALISLHPEIDYEPLAGREPQELLPEDTSQSFKDLVWTADMAWKVILAGGIGKTVTPALHKGLQSLYAKYMRDVSAKYNLPKEVYISPEKIREFHGRGREEVISESESNVLKGLGLTREQYVTALKQGIDIRISSEKIITAVDKPWLKSIKEALGIRPYRMKFTKEAGPITIKTHMERLAPPLRGTPKARPVKPAETKPEFTFTSKKGHQYEKIGDTWYGSKGREITNKFVITAAEKGKVGVGTIDEVVDRAIEVLPDVQVDKVMQGLVETEVIEKPAKVVKPKDRLKIKPTVKEPKAVEPPEPITEVDSQTGHPEPVAISSAFRELDPARTEQLLKAYPPLARMTDPYAILARLNTEVNSWLDGNDKIDIAQIRKLASGIAVTAMEQGAGKTGIAEAFKDMTLEQVVEFSELASEFARWVETELDRLKIERTVKGPVVAADKILEVAEPTIKDEKVDWFGEGTKLYSGLAPIQELFDRFTTPKKTKTKLSEKPPDPFPAVREEAREIVFKLIAGLNLASYGTNKFVNSIEQRLTDKQQDTMVFVLEKTDVPKEFNRPDLQKVINKDKKHLEEVSKDIKEWFDLGWKKIKTHIPDLTVKQIEDYVTHLWDIPRHKKAEATAWFSTQNQFLERRFIPTYAEGIKRGYKPKTLNISEIIKVHDTVSNRAIENTKYIESLLAMERDGISLIQRGSEAPLDWIEVDYPALTRRIPLKKKEAKKKGEFVKEVKVRVHPDLVRPLKAIFEERFDHPVISAYEAINGIMKKSMLSLQLFHHGALFEVGVAAMGLLKTANIYFNPVKIYKALVRGEFDVFAKEAIAKDSIESGMQYGATADIPISRIQGYLNDLARVSSDTPMANRVTSFLRDFNSVWDKALWTYLHDTIKLYAYESFVGRLNPKMDAEMTRKSKREIAQFINDTAGGQNWNTLMMTPKEVQMLTWSLLSADWTVSTTRQALSPTGIGKVYDETKGLRKKMGWRFWARAGLYFGVGMNLLNVLLRNKDMEENPQYYEDKDYSFFDKTMFGNTVGKRTYLFNGRYEDGTERYIRWGKQFRDFFELFVNPLKKIGGKVAPVPQLISEISTGHTLSGFKNDDIYGTEGLEKAKGIIKTIAKSPLPISIIRYMREDMEFKPLDMVMQSTKGMSRYSSMEYFKKAIIDGDEELLRDTYVGTLRNNLPAYTLFTSALSWAEAEATAAVAEDVKKIDDAKTGLSLADSISDRKRYGKILSRLEKEKADKKIGLKLFKSAVVRSRVYRELESGRGAPMLPSTRSRNRIEEAISFD